MKSEKRKVKSEKTNRGRGVYFFALLSCLLFVISCENPASSPADSSATLTTPAEEKGSFSLTLSNRARTILPATPGTDDFAVYNLAFTPTSGGSAQDVDRTNATLPAEPVLLDPGTYSLVVIAYKDSGKATPLARGTLTGIVITAGANTSRIITLEAQLSGGTGAFKWTITFPASVTTATMAIGTNTPENLTSGTTVSRNLSSGMYNLTFNLEGSDGKVVWKELLYVYQNLESVFNFYFTNAHFSNPNYTVTYKYNDGSTSDKEQSILHGGTLAATKPANPTRTGYAFGGWFTDDNTFANEWNFNTAVTGSFTLYAKWNQVYTVTFSVNGGSGMAPAAQTAAAGSSITIPNVNWLAGAAYYTFGGWNTASDGTGTNYIAGASFTPSGNITLYAKWDAITTLAGKLAWLQSNTQSDTSYTIVVSASESIGPQYLSYSGKSNITITLNGDGSNRIIDLSSNGSMFDIRSGVTLILGNNITLRGRSNNTASLVSVNSGGTFTMNTGSTITGNTTSTAGGVYVFGTFNMTGGAISGNNASYGGGVVLMDGIFNMTGGTISGNTAPQGGAGGGVCISGGTFTMSNGTITGNTASSGGGGVFVDGGTFTMSNGTITGNTASYAGGGVYVQFGIFNKTGGTITGYSSDNTSGNAVKNSSGVILNDWGHAAYAANDSGITARKEYTAGSGDNLFYNGSILTPAFSGAWDYPAPATVTTVTVSPSTAVVVKGVNRQFSASVSGTNSPAQTVTWSIIETGKHSGTTITTNGLLTVSASEALSTLTVRATSTVDPLKYGDAAVTVSSPATSITVSPNTAKVTRGNTQQFTATPNVVGSPVTWSVTGGVTGTSISAGGLLTIDAKETAGTLTVKAVSTADSNVFGTATVTVIRNLWAQNTQTSAYYKLDAQMLAEGAHCTIWVELDASGNPKNVTTTTALQMANDYDAQIYQAMIDAFSGSITYLGTTYDNAMDLADYLADEDGKLCILLLDIQDSFTGISPNTAYTAGYFWMGNFWAETASTRSNECDMIYVDTYPGDPTSDSSKRTLAHEMQHLINFVVARTQRLYNYMDTWINEGLSGAAENVCFGGHGNRLTQYNNDSTGLIRRGNNFFVWGNRVGSGTGNHQNANLDDYATVYLFFQWLKLQSGGTAIYKNIIQSPYTNYQAIVNALGYSDWETLLTTWLAANYIMAPSGPYGYMGDPTLTVQARTVPSGMTNVDLYPGEGVYSVTNNSTTMPSPGLYISYTGLNKSSAAMAPTIYVPGALLTYNANTDISGSSETGITTGIAANVEIASGDQSFDSMLESPYAIDAEDMLRRNGHSGWEPLPIPSVTPLRR